MLYFDLRRCNDWFMFIRAFIGVIVILPYIFFKGKEDNILNSILLEDRRMKKILDSQILIYFATTILLSVIISIPFGLVYIL